MDFFIIYILKPTSLLFEEDRYNQRISPVGHHIIFIFLKIYPKMSMFFVDKLNGLISRFTDRFFRLYLLDEKEDHSDVS